MGERETVFIEVISGPEGPSLYVGDENCGYRLAGPKPWGGGRTIHKFRVIPDELVRETLKHCPSLRADLAVKRDQQLVDAAKMARMALAWGSVSDQDAIDSLDVALAAHGSDSAERTEAAYDEKQPSHDD